MPFPFILHRLSVPTSALLQGPLPRDLTLVAALFPPDTLMALSAVAHAPEAPLTAAPLDRALLGVYRRLRHGNGERPAATRLPQLRKE